MESYVESKNKKPFDPYPASDWRPLVGLLLFLFVASLPVYWDHVSLTAHWPHWISNVISSVVMGVALVSCLYLLPKVAREHGGQGGIIFCVGGAFFLALGVLANWI